MVVRSSPVITNSLSRTRNEGAVCPPKDPPARLHLDQRVRSEWNASERQPGRPPVANERIATREDVALGRSLPILVVHLRSGHLGEDAIDDQLDELLLVGHIAVERG